MVIYIQERVSFWTSKGFRIVLRRLGAGWDYNIQKRIELDKGESSFKEKMSAPSE